MNLGRVQSRLAVALTGALVTLTRSADAAPPTPARPATSVAATSGKTSPSAAKAPGAAKAAQPAASATSDDDEDAVRDMDLSSLPERERKIIEAERSSKWQDGPMKVSLPAGATVELPAGYRYLDVPQSKTLLNALGQIYTDGSQGMIAPADPEADWRAYLAFDDSGYVKDDEKIDADDLLKALREGQDEVNKERSKLGHPALHLGNWSESPRYDRTKHHLVWGLRVSVDGETSEAINYNTRILGRRGYLSLNLVSEASEIQRYVPEAEKLLGVTTFNQGERYADFSEKTDKIAEYGLAGLILGGAGLGAAKVAGKVGLIALLAKGGKGLILALLAPFAALKKWLSRSKSPSQDA